MKLKNFKALLLAVTVLFCTVLLCACSAGGKRKPAPTEPLSAEAAYAVTVLDAAGKPCNGVIVKFMQNGTQVAMQPVDANGVATKTLKRGTYSVECIYTADNTTAYCDPAAAALSAEKIATTVTIYKAVSGEGVSLTVDGAEVKAYHVATGGNYVSVVKQTRNYFLFTPTEAGTYTISVDNKDMKLGYYGSPYFVQSNSAAEVVDNAFTMSIFESMIGTDNTGTAVMVLGVDGIAEDAKCILNVQRTGDPAWNVGSEPWTEYKPTHTPAPFTLDQGGKQLVYVDITGTTANNQVIFNEADGFYHFGKADGPVVYLHLGKGAPYVSLQVMIQGDGPMGGAPLRKYYWNGEGREKENFVKREDYTTLMVSYFENMDGDTGVYPLTQDLAYIIQNACSGWWDATSPDFIMEGCNPEIGWMFALCYLA